MDTLSILAMAGGVLGLLAFVKVNSLSKQVYLLRSDLKIAATKSEGKRRRLLWLRRELLS